MEIRRENGEVKSVRRQTRQGGELLPKPSISVCCASQRNLASCKVKTSSPSCCQCLSEVSRLHLKCSSRPGVLHYILCAHGLTHWGLPNVSWDINMCTSKCSTGSCILSVGQHPCRRAGAGFYIPLPLPAYRFEALLNMADPP